MRGYLEIKKRSNLARLERKINKIIILYSCFLLGTREIRVCKYTPNNHIKRPFSCLFYQLNQIQCFFECLKRQPSLFLLQRRFFFIIILAVYICKCFFLFYHFINNPPIRQSAQITVINEHVRFEFP